MADKRGQIDKLSDYILRNDLMPKGFEGGAGDCAIHIIENLRRALEEIAKTVKLDAYAFNGMAARVYEISLTALGKEWV
jgi:hypothetical protein